MKYILVLGMLFPIISAAQVINITDSKRVNCDTAYTTLELSLCSKYLLDKSEKTMDSLEKVILSYLDTLIIEDDKFKKDFLKDNPKYPIDLLSDYRKIKKLFIKSQALFHDYIKVETDIIGEFYGTGTGRILAENLEAKALIEERITQMNKILK